jgi:hypothetical protein
MYIAIRGTHREFSKVGNLSMILSVIFLLTASTFAVEYPDPTPSYSIVPFNTTSGLAYGSFIGFGVAFPNNWTKVVKPSIFTSIKTKASTEEPSCFVAYVENPPTFSFSAAIILPQVNTPTSQIYWIYQSFVDEVAIHEYWHLSIHKAYANGPWAALESWLKTYQSSACTTAQKAIDNATKDIKAAIAKVEATQSTFKDAKTTDHPSDNVVQFLPIDSTHSKPWVRMNKPAWGSAAFNAVQAIKVTFDSPVSGDCCKQPPKGE